MTSGDHAAAVEPREDQPLLGQPGEVVQNIYRNFLSGTALVAQVGVWVLTAVVWTAIFSHDLIFPFSPHPAILVLQPTATPQQKTLGTRVHFALLTVSTLAFIAAFVFIEVNKGDHPRLTSPHGILGLITYIIIVLQALVGIAQYFLPVAIFGSVENGKKVYKYHRISGYVLLVLELATISAATQTTYNKNTLGIKLWVVLVTAVLVILGVGARIRKHKLGF
ncbi:Uncharacterized protein T310_8328 [Rasamsonia emersonii CBS 393.64]|uniref:Cytochrome b561 domain-containing protein n=1 Tax=Rasamsonia emersonii (strain ATCC 16479 / CBS 393.64 / IMI 116815) TaxID=1408163 RepID=A0A0F4YHP9_RASE3|nr:Uncharacterized protein T310_8328 [Rasamsonia emersonii CBS 393.64]KKA17734.1 Uncharacterized protein T310_8328 [Rasamsonia emersonii CBS 393.64]